MSYTVDILAGSLPASYDEALAIRDEITDARDEHLGTGPDLGFQKPSPEMRALHDRLTSRYPCITVNDEGPWSDGPLINNFGQQAATLGISFSRVEEVLPFLIATANSMGFWVLDAQDENVHLPGGDTLKPSDEPESNRTSKLWWQFWK